MWLKKKISIAKVKTVCSSADTSTWGQNSGLDTEVACCCFRNSQRMQTKGTPWRQTDGLHDFPAPKFKSLLTTNLSKNFLEGAVENLLDLALSSIRMLFFIFDSNPSTLAWNIPGGFRDEQGPGPQGQSPTQKQPRHRPWAPGHGGMASLSSNEEEDAPLNASLP